MSLSKLLLYLGSTPLIAFMVLRFRDQRLWLMSISIIAILGISVNEEILSQANPLFIVNNKTNVK